MLDYHSQLTQKNLPAPQRADYHKWLRHYFDFCIRTGEPIDRPESGKKLNQKSISMQQTQVSRQSAHAAIAIYYESKGVLPATPRPVERHNDPIPTTQTGKSWQSVYDKLAPFPVCDAAIKHPVSGEQQNQRFAFYNSLEQKSACKTIVIFKPYE